MIAPWQRGDRRATGRVADAMLLAFHRGPLRGDVPLDLDRFGVPGPAALEVLEVREHDDAGWLAGWRGGAMRDLAAEQLGGALAALDGCDRCHAIRAIIADPAELTYLQAMWALARWLVARGAVVVLDVFPLRYWPAAAVAGWDPTAPIDPAREIALVCQAARPESATGQLVHTRGLGKVARPDLVAVCEPARLREAAEVVAALAARLVDGYMPAAGEVVELAEGRATVDPAPGEGVARALQLNNDAWVVTLG